MTPTPTQPSQSARRRFIQLIGGGAVLATTAPLAGCSDGMPDAAVRPWFERGDPADLRRDMLAHALLAPNPHNRQPWLADLRRDGAITLVCDGDRLLPETDPFGRQIVIGCGAFVELAVLAAAERGVAVQVQTFPDGEPAVDQLPGGRAMARLVLGPPGSATPDPLFTQVRRRHTHKGVYDSARAVPSALTASWLANAQAAGLRAGLADGTQQLQALRTLTRQAYEIECTTPRTWLESAHLMRIGPDAIARHRDGISIAAPMPRLLHAVGLFDPLQVPVQGSTGHRAVMDRFDAHQTGSGYLWLASAGNGRRAQLASGRAYVRAHLMATAAGVDMHPLSQALQEFPEVREPRSAVHRLLGLDPAQHTLQMLARVGYGVTRTGPSPRRELAGLVRA
jgi:hypothetical protein